VEIFLQLHQASFRGIISSSDLNLWLTPNTIVQHPNCSWTFYRYVLKTYCNFKSLFTFYDHIYIYMWTILVLVLEIRNGSVQSFPQLFYEFWNFGILMLWSSPPALIFWGYVYSVLDCPPRLSWRFLSSVVS
jgi:hypothetical protein